MKTHLLVALAVAGCAPSDGAVDPFAALTPDGRMPTPSLTLSVSAGEAVPGSQVTFSVTGAADSEPVYFGRAGAEGSGPCLAVAGGLCLDITGNLKLMGVVYADASGDASLTITLPAGAPVGQTLASQAIVIRGLRGVASVKSNATAVDIVSDIYGCTNPAASNYDPAATADDGSCATAQPTVPGYAGPAGPDLSPSGWTLCSGTTSGSTGYSAYYSPCASFSQVRFACSVDANATAEFVSDPIAIAGSAFTDGTCDDWAQGSNSNYGAGKILSIDSTNPGCGQYNVGYQLYMDMVSPQWGCAGTYNTHTTGGRMWMYGLGGAIAGCTDPAATNYNPAATQDDGSCTYSGGGPTVPGFAGEPGPDLSASGWSQCGGTSSAGTTSTQFYQLCAGYSEIMFACSTNADTTPEYSSPAFPLTGQVLTDATCDDWTGGSNSPYGSGHILSVDSSNPGCGQYNVGYQLYMDMVSPQWGCAGTY
ncbi:MAG TPA: hypothetical protein PKA64_25645, partial [Myxococcota bacterium]|nr:hypothetical protein [Myxococcota bacterium]